MIDGLPITGGRLPASVQQKGIWFHSLTSEAFYWNFIQKRFFKGVLSITSLKSALELIIKRHASLRTNFCIDEEELFQVINDEIDIDTVFIHLRYPGGDPDEFVRQETDKEEHTPFDLEQGALIRLKILEMPDHWVLILNMNHIITDSFSMEICWNELAGFYNSLSAGTIVAGDRLPPQYSGYSMQQREFSLTPAFHSQKSFWMERFSDELPIPDLAFYRAGSVPHLYHAEMEIDKDLAENIRSISLKKKVLYSAVFQLAYAVFLHKYSGLPTVVIGNIINGRGFSRNNYKDVIGLFAGRLIHIYHIDREQTLERLLKEVNSEILAGFNNSEVAYEELARQVNRQKGAGLQPLFNAVFNMVKGVGRRPGFGDTEEFDAPGFENKQVGDNQYDIGITVSDNGSQVRIRLDLKCENELKDLVGLLLRNYVTILQCCVNHSNKTISQAIGLSEEEISLLGSIQHGPVADISGDLTVVHLFLEQTVRTPDAPAVVFLHRQLTYRELNEQSDRLAHYLRSNGVGEETLVGICMERSIEMVVGLLGILKAGGAYVPIDPEYPRDRITYLLADIDSKIVLTSRHCMTALDFTGRIIVLDEELAGLPESPAGGSVSIRQEQLMYVIYTSGSTGTPKGVMNQHGGVVNRLLWAQRYWNLDEGDSILQKTTFCFDVSVWELFLPLIAGARLVMAEPGGHKDAVYLKGIIDDRKITMLHFVPTMLDVFLQDILPGEMAGLRHVICSGEELKSRHVELFRQKLPHVSLHNLYGPTEAAIDVTCLTLSAKAGSDTFASIGRPVDNVSIYVLDRTDHPVAPGMVGEIVIGGIQVARGYYHRAELSAEKFFAGHFAAPGDSQPCYRTGDLGRWLPNGHLQYLGRIDHQVKIRGFRIEPGEIESIALKSGLIGECVVLAPEDATGNKRLVGYAVAAEDFDFEPLQYYLQQRLPDYMVPAWWVRLDAIPRTVSGKIDKKALPQGGPAFPGRNSYNAPRNEPERILKAIWEQLLGIKDIGIRDDFFKLGGDSIITIQVASRVRQSGYDLRPKDVFTCQTIERLSALALSRKKTKETQAEQGILRGECGLLPMQQWYLEKERGNPQIGHFNQSLLVGIDRRIEAGRLGASITDLTRLHDVLRCCFRETPEGWQQYFGDGEPVMEICDLSHESADHLHTAFRHRAAATQKSLDIAHGKIMAAVLFLMPPYEKTNRLLLVIHHLAVDGVSWRILLEDLEQMLSGDARRPETPQRVKTSSCRQWHAALEEYGRSARVLSQQPFWEGVLNMGQPLPVDMTADRPLWRKDIGTVIVRLPAKQTASLLHDVHGAYHTEINDLLLAALAGALHAFTGNTRHLIGLEGHGREDDLMPQTLTDRTIGWLTSLFPVLLQTDAGNPPDHLIKATKETLRSIPDKGLSFGVLKFINKAGCLSGPAPWEVLFNYMGQLDNLIEGLFTVCTESAGPNVGDLHKISELLSINCWITQGMLEVHWDYSMKHHRVETIEHLANGYIDCLQQLIDHCLATTREVFTPADFGLQADIGYREMDHFLLSETGGQRVESVCRMSGLQEGMLFHGLYDEGVKAYIGQLSCELPGLQPDLLVRSWEWLMQRHSILRTAFYPGAFRVPVQCVFSSVSLPIVQSDLSMLGEEEQQAAIAAYENDDRNKPFDLKKPPLMRISLIRRTETDYQMIWTAHHLLMDGWSMAILLNELRDVYETLQDGRKPIGEYDRYADYIHFLDGRDKEKEKSYWKTYLAEIMRPSLLPFIGHASDRNSGIGTYAEQAFRLDRAFTGRIQQYARNLGITINTLAQGVWAYLLSRYTGERNIVYGVTVSGRPAELPMLEQRVGMYINTVPICIRVDDEISVRKYLQNIQSAQGAGLPFQFSPLSDVRKWTGIEGELFDSLLVFENYPVNEHPGGRPAAFHIRRPKMKEQTNFPLTISIGGKEDMWIGFSYNTRLLDSGTVNRIGGHFRHVLTQLVDQDTGRLGSLRLMDVDELRQVLESFNDTATPFGGGTVVDLFREQAARRPGQEALISGFFRLTYKELDVQSSKLAHYLRGLGVKEDMPVVLCTERSPAMLVGILAILKAGGAYVPIDPGYPRERIGFILADTMAAFAVISRKNRSLLDGWTGRAIVIEDSAPEIAHLPETCPINELQPDSLAYILYTSGSTGKPKGVMVEHRNVMNLLYSFQQVAGAGDGPGLSVCSYVFDVSVWEFFTSLCFGNTLHLLDEEEVLDPAAIAGYILTRRIATAYIAPVILPMVVSCLEESPDKACLNRLLVGVMPIRQGILQRFADRIPGLHIINGYGPTETTICATFFPFHSAVSADDVTPIGKPLANNRIYILDEQQAPVPIGVAGEICVAGAGVGRGYWNNPSMTAERFVANPYCPATTGPFTEKDTVLYRTGDLGKWMADGNIVYLRRADDQVKIRGFRVELGEIESVIAQSRMVRQSVVVVRTDGSMESQLVAYVVADGTFDRTSMREYLLLYLPEYMVPGVWVTLDTLPVTRNGKIDKDALPHPFAVTDTDHMAPRNELETSLVSMWEELLEMDQVGIDQNFLSIGGHSLLGIKLVARVEEKFKVRMPLKLVFDLGTIMAIAEYITLMQDADDVVKTDAGKQVFEL